MEVGKINKWADLLLDMGKRNNLIHFRNTKLSGAELVFPDFDTVFCQAGRGAQMEVFDPKLEDEDFFEIIAPKSEEINKTAEETTANGTDEKVGIEEKEELSEDTSEAVNRETSESTNRETIEGANSETSEDTNEDTSDEDSKVLEKDQTMTKKEFIEHFSPKLKKGQILVYNTACKPIEALKNINKRAKSAIEETGVNILFLAFGFVNWFEESDPRTTYKAPLLLLPATIQNESPLEPYCIKAIDDDFFINPTFSYFLQKTYQLELPDYDEEENFLEYFARVEQMLARLRFTLEKECKLGIFSFQKINMYRDLKDNLDYISTSKTVCAMLGELQEEPSSAGGEFLELHNVVDADSSQSEAIRMAKLGKSFVLQGPPGTGKSQTITNIVAECLSDGKSVLFVSEKLAALNVVYDKLKKVGMEEFCLELHSHKANKKQVINELCKTLKLPKSVLSERAKKELVSKQEAEEKLGDYVQALHEYRPVINRSLYQMFEEVSACRRSPELAFAIQNIEKKDDAYLSSAIASLKRFAEFVPSIGYEYQKNPWYGFFVPSLTMQTRMTLREDLSEVLSLVEHLMAFLSNTFASSKPMDAEKSNQSSNGMGFSSSLEAENFFPSDWNLHKVELLRSFYELVKNCKFLTPKLFEKEVLEKTLSVLPRWTELSKSVHIAKERLEETYEKDIYQLDGASLHKALVKKCSTRFSRLFNKEYKEIKNSLRLSHKTGKKHSYQELVEVTDLLRGLQENLEEFDASLASLDKEGKQSLFASGFNGIDTNLVELQNEINLLSMLRNSDLSLEQYETLSLQEFEAKKPEFAKMEATISGYENKAQTSLSRLQSQFDSTIFDLTNASLDVLFNRLSNCEKNIDTVENWWEFSKLYQTMKELALLAPLDTMISYHIPKEQLANTYQKAFLTQWIDLVLHASPKLLELSRISHDEAIKQFKEKDVLSFEINKADIRANVSKKRPGLDIVAQGSAVATLLREGEKKRKQKSIRTLLADIGELALTLKPCFLMSPLSVSTFLGPQMNFDVVVFDEASQIFPQDAIGAIYRGKQLIVVGDSKQMPPSNFFQAGGEEEENEDEALSDFESILDLCSTSLPQRRLKWHYRSRYEQLIAFSNQNFYDNELVTFPSNRKDREGIGVDYHYVDGIFDRQTKTNFEEAKHIVDLIFEHIDNYPKRSLGVVAFSVSQQTLIEKLLAKKRLADSTKESFFRSDVEEPFFVKNLETVQGDERDTILFSVAYAKDSKGKLLMNFGPLNRVGGERRLNVAVTRAKHNVVLVSSMHAHDIDLSRTQSIGAKLLHDYLAYAEYGVEQKDTKTKPLQGDFSQREDSFEEDIRELLCDYGYEVDKKVGCSAQQIDLAVREEDGMDYALAIETDGETYCSFPTARDRDRNRQSVLENMGWNYYRIWSTDWFRNHQVEKKRLLEAVEKATKQGNQKGLPTGASNELSTEQKEKNSSEKEITTQTTKAYHLFEEMKEEVAFEFPKYQRLDAEVIQDRYRGDLGEIAWAMLVTEAPMSEEWLDKRLLPLMGREKVTNVVAKMVQDALAKKHGRDILYKNGFFYIRNMEIPQLRICEGEERDIRYIALEELANGLREILKQNVSVEKAGLFRAVATALGHNRAGDAMTKRLLEALELLKDEIIEDGETVTIRNNS